MTSYIASFPSEIGVVRVQATDNGITEIAFSEKEIAPSPSAPAFLEECVRQLCEYFAGERTAFHSLPLVLRSTEFQDRVWDAAGEIPFGQTCTYGELANTIGSPGASQAVGTALSRNAICIIIPCHRILPQSGEAGGYAWGTWRKKWLVRHEGLSERKVR